LAVEHDIVPFDGADVFQQGEIDSIVERVALTQDRGDFPRLPVDDARDSRHGFGPGNCESRAEVQAYRRADAFATCLSRGTATAP